MSIEIIDRKKSQFHLNSDITKRELKKLLKYSNLKSIQFSEPVTDQNIWKNISEIIIPQKPELGIYIYSNHNKPWDLSFLSFFPKLKTFSIGGYMECSNIDSIKNLQYLKSLSINAYNIDNFDFLYKINSSLKSLILGSTKSKRFNISIISRFKNLESLSIWGHKQGIENISKLSSLEKLHLSVNLESLDFLTQIDKLWSIKLSFSHVKSLNALTKLKNLKYLDIIQLRKLDNLEFISGLEELQYLVLTNLPNIKTLPDLSLNDQLRRIDFENLKSLSSLESLQFVKNLEEFVFVNCSNLQPEDFYPVIKNKNIKNIIAGFGSDRKNKRFEELKDEFGLKNNKWSEFRFK